jgi:hypothetical protein
LHYLSRCWKEDILDPLEWEGMEEEVDVALSSRCLQVGKGWLFIPYIVGLAVNSIPSPCLPFVEPIAVADWQRCIGRWDVLGDWFVIVVDIKSLIVNHHNIFCTTSAGMEDRIFDGNGDADRSTLAYPLSRRSSRSWRITCGCVPQPLF